MKPYRAAPGLQIAGYAFEFHATRLAQYYLLKVILPLLLVVMMSWTVFWIDPTVDLPLRYWVRGAKAALPYAA